MLSCKKEGLLKELNSVCNSTFVINLLVKEKCSLTLCVVAGRLQKEEAL